MRIETLKKMFDACYQAKRARDLLPPLPDGVTSSYIHYLDAIQILEKQEIHVKVSSSFLMKRMLFVVKEVK